MQGLLKGNIGIPRANMPQLPSGEAFWRHLAAQGCMLRHMRVPSVKLRSTQSELNLTKICAFIEAMQAGRLPKACLYASADFHIVDGHHRWAADVVLGVRQRDLRHRTMLVSTVDMSIREVINEAFRFLDLEEMRERTT